VTGPDEATDGRGASGAKRLVGVRTDYASAPFQVRAWVEETLGAPVVTIQPRTGGMSPAVAVSLRAANGRRAFVKAVGGEINPDTPGHFRHEVAVLKALPPAPYRAGTLATYDDGDWVAIALEDINGSHPDWGSRLDRDAVFEAVRHQTDELTPIPAGLPGDSSRRGIAKYLETMRAAAPAELAGLPRWAVTELPSLVDLCRRCLDHQHDETFCHWDIRHDNILIRHRDGQPVLLDWGRSRRGPRWGDAVVFALEWVESSEFDEIVATIGLSPEEETDVTGFIAGIGCHLLMTAVHPAPPALPNLRVFGRQLGSACLQGVRRRLEL
jgi:serine/threonine protein kinase